jgi:hypothetical protein
MVVVSNGGPSFIQGFRERTHFDGELYTDPDRRAYEALSLRRDLKAALNPKLARRALAAYRSGHRQTATQGDARQMGGVFVIAQTGEIVFGYASEHAGDHPSVESLVAAIGDANDADSKR